MKKTIKWIGIVLGVLIYWMIIIHNMEKDFTNNKTSSKISNVNTKELQKRFTILVESGLIKQDLRKERREILVDPVMWNLLNLQQKRTFCYIMGEISPNHHGKIKDYYNGKTLAKYSQSWGSEIYP